MASLRCEKLPPPVVIAGLVLVLTGCEAFEGFRLAPDAGADEADAATGLGPDGATDGARSDPGLKLPDGGSGGVGGGNGCATFESEAEATALLWKTDVVFAVDSSESMLDETQALEEAINAFATALTSNAIDLRIVLLAAYPGSTTTASGGVCVPSPLGSGLCPPEGSDTRLPILFHHPTATVLGGNTLNVLIDTYPDYRAQLRPGVRKTVVIVTDKDATDPPHDSAQQFIADFTALEPALVVPWRMFGVYAFSECANSIEVGTVYREIVSQTQGLHADICLQDLAGALDVFAAHILEAALPACSFALPTLPLGFTLEFGRINIQLVTEGQPQLIYAVPSAVDCHLTEGGWYYDDPSAPRWIVLCPATCQSFRRTPGASIRVVLGCATVPR